MAQELPVITFALTPAKHNDGILDYGSTEGRKLYLSSITALPIKIDVTPHQTLMLLTEMSRKSYDNGWGQLWKIPCVYDANGDVTLTRDLLMEHGMITFKQVQDHAASYAATSTRMAQNGLACYTCLSDSLTPEGRTKLLADSNKVKVTDQAIANGPLLLKLILDRATTTTRSTLTLLFQRVNALDALMERGGSDVEKFNEDVKVIVLQIQERGAKVEDENLMVNLFRAYLSVNDSVFHRYMEIQKDNYNDGVRDLSPNKLMELAGNKYKSLLEEDIWQAPTARDKEIIALRAQVAELKTVPSTKGNSKDAEPKKKKGAGNKKADKWAWKTVPPKTGEAHTKKFGDKTYHWCPKHESWTVHTPEQCSKPAASDETTSVSTQSLQLNTALMSIMEDVQDEDEEE